MRRLACLAGQWRIDMSDTDEVDAWLDANAALLGIDVAPEWRDSVRLHLRFTRDRARSVLDFPLPDEADPAPVFRA
jgi:hypothetical protein